MKLNNIIGDVKMRIMKEFTDRTIIIIKELMKLMILYIFLFFIIGVPSAYIFQRLNADPEIAGLIMGIVIAVVFIVIDYKKLHCWRKINDSKYCLYKMIIESDKR